MLKEFRSKRAILWLAGIALLVLGILAVAVILPMTAPTPGAGGPDIRVPNMQNVPPEQTPKMKLDLEEKY